jgi:hypothetical protein
MVLFLSPLFRLPLELAAAAAVVVQRMAQRVVLAKVLTAVMVQVVKYRPLAAAVAALVGRQLDLEAQEVHLIR